MAPRPTQLLHGLRLSGDVAVPRAAHADGPADFEVRLSSPEAPPEEPPKGEVVAALRGPGAGYAAALRDETLTVRFFETAEFEVDLAGGTIAARPAPGRGEAMVPVLLAGNVLALVLGLRGACVLHASAVELGGSCVAFAGGSGAGKSTAAALLCSAGGALVSDDAARVEAEGDEFSVHRGPHELRLRPQAAALAERVDGARRATGDERVGVEARAAAEDTTPLGAIVFPRWPRGESAVAVSRLRPREALEALLRCPRVIGWQAQGPIRAHFRISSQIAETVPAFSLELPHGHLDDPALPDALRDALADAGALAPTRAT
jgi:hypothetical protein